MPSINAIAIGVLLNDSQEIFMQLRHDPGSPAHNFWEFPGGGIEFGETPEQAVIREVHEESGYDVEIVRLLPKIYTNIWNNDFQVLLLAYQCKITGGEFKKQDLEVADGKFFERGAIDYGTTLPFTKEIIELLDK